jgi:hypothetical protein
VDKVMKNITDIKPPKNQSCYFCGVYLPKEKWKYSFPFGLVCKNCKDSALLTL